MLRKVCIRFKDSGRIGGPSTFMRNLQRELDRLDYRYTKHVTGAKGYFFPVSASISRLKRAKLFGGRVIQRLDGVYTQEHTVAQNAEAKFIYQNYTDFSVFQSQFSRDIVFDYFGSVPEPKYKVIVNGADLDLFYPEERASLRKKVRLVATGNFRIRVMLEPAIKAIDMLRQEGWDIEFTVIGPLVMERLKELVEARDYVTHKVITDQASLGAELRRHDVFVYSFMNAACPNSVVEAVSSGLPVVGFDSGAIGELCEFNSDLLAFVSENLVHKHEDFADIRVYEKLKICLENYSYFKESALNNSRRYDMRACAREYINVFDSL